MTAWVLLTKYPKRLEASSSQATTIEIPFTAGCVPDPEKNTSLVFQKDLLGAVRGPYGVLVPVLAEEPIVQEPLDKTSLAGKLHAQDDHLHLWLRIGVVTVSSVAKN